MLFQRELSLFPRITRFTSFISDNAPLSYIGIGAVGLSLIGLWFVITI